MAEITEQFIQDLWNETIKMDKEYVISKVRAIPKNNQKELKALQAMKYKFMSKKRILFYVFNQLEKLNQ